jgi:uncharacterized protein (DUF924 family)
METPSSIVKFWFGSSTSDIQVVNEKSALWWSKDDHVDQEIKERFESLLILVERGELESWEASPEGLLALILLTDQFSRNIYRGISQSFRYDPIARKLCSLGFEQGVPARLRLIERVFFYLPLEHSESKQDQEKSVKEFQNLVSEVPEEHRGIFQGYVDFAIKHYDIVSRFGRFPHRNAILGRESTPEEINFLKEPGSSF